MARGYIPPEEFLYYTVFGALTSLVLAVPLQQSQSTQGRQTMEVGEVIGYTPEDFGLALQAMEDSLERGQYAGVTICTEFLPTEDEIDNVYASILATGCHISHPSARIIDGVPTTEFLIRKGSPQWAVIIPLLVPIFAIGLIAFGIIRIEQISRALVPLLLVTFGGLTILAAVLAKPAAKYIEAGGRIPR